ncbi:MAG: hypothetical protein AAF743_02130, partial [Planctomycetota bacterium]
ANAPGKRAYVDFLRQRHGDFAALPGTYDVAANSWEQLPGDGFERVMLADHRVRADDEAFLGHIAETWYTLIGETFRATAPGVPIFGERYKFRDHPPAVLKAAARWVDAISLQVGPQVGPAAGPGPDDEARFDHDAIHAIHQLTGKPVMVCDHQISFPPDDGSDTLWHRAESEADAAKLAVDFITTAAAEPWCVGHGWCGLVDRWDASRALTKQGIFDRAGEPHAELQRALADANRDTSATRGAEPWQPNRS